MLSYLFQNCVVHRDNWSHVYAVSSKLTLHYCSYFDLIENLVEGMVE